VNAEAHLLHFGPLEALILGEPFEENRIAQGESPPSVLSARWVLITSSRAFMKGVWASPDQTLTNAVPPGTSTIRVSLMPAA
jgi:hypothetical protein